MNHQTYERSWSNVRYHCVSKIKELYNELDELDSNDKILKSLLWTKIMMYKEMLVKIGYDDEDLIHIRDSNKYGVWDKYGWYKRQQ